MDLKCVLVEPDPRNNQGKTKIEPILFLRKLESNEKVQAVVKEIKRHMLLHKAQVEYEELISFTFEYSDAVINITAAYQGQRFKENLQFDNLIYHTDLFSMVEQSNKLHMFINGAPN